MNIGIVSSPPISVLRRSARIDNVVLASHLIHKKWIFMLNQVQDMRIYLFLFSQNISKYIPFIKRAS